MIHTHHAARWRGACEWLVQSSRGTSQSGRTILLGKAYSISWLAGKKEKKEPSLAFGDPEPRGYHGDGVRMGRCGCIHPRELSLSLSSSIESQCTPLHLGSRRCSGAWELGEREARGATEGVYSRVPVLAPEPKRTFARIGIVRGGGLDVHV